jgi:ATP-binding protein involved in chromosome partitioning
MENTIKLLGGIKNPINGKSLTEENRWVNAEANDEGGIVITYKRDGIGPSEKRKIEDDIVEALSTNYEADKILVKTVSSATQPKSSATEGDANKEAPKASLKVGHGVNGNKKRIPGVKKVIAVSSCKGGVGKSTVSVNLALALKNLGHKVGLLDADIYGPSLPLLLNKKGAKPEATAEKKIKPLDSYGMSFISFGLFINDNDPVIWRGPMLGGVLNQFFFDTDWGELDFLVIDLPPGTGDTQLSLVQNTEVDGVVVVSTPQSVAVADTIKGLRMFQQVNTPIIGMVENMSYFSPDGKEEKYYIFGKDGVQKVAKELEVPFLGSIPLEMAMREAGDDGKPYMVDETYKDNEGYKSYMDIAKKVAKINEEKGFLGKLFK